jgi:hypothetical protein
MATARSFGIATKLLKSAALVEQPTGLAIAHLVERALAISDPHHT